MEDLSNLTEKKEKLYSPQKALGSSFCNVPSSPCLQQPKQDTFLDALKKIQWWTVVHTIVLLWQEIKQLS